MDDFAFFLRCFIYCLSTCLSSCVRLFAHLFSRRRGLFIVHTYVHTQLYYVNGRGNCVNVQFTILIRAFSFTFARRGCCDECAQPPWIIIDYLSHLCHPDIRESTNSRLHVHTVEPLYNGHRWGPKFCPL